MRLFAVIIVVRRTDIIFAVDSVPAIFAITPSTFIVWSADAFAVLELRPLYFMLVGMIDRFVYLSVGLSIVLVFVATKFLISDLVGKVTLTFSLPFIATVVIAPSSPTSTRLEAGNVTNRPESEAPRRGSG